MRLNKNLTVIAVFALSMSAATANAAKGENDKGKSSKVDVCHFDADSELFHVININGNAVAQHFANHGDVYPGDFFTDSDGDGFGDALGGTDSCPNPGFVDNNSDEFPDDPDEWVDSDGDGVGDNGDAFPNDPNETADSDGDGVGDNGDAFPNDPNEDTDTDGDGIGDNGDACPTEAGDGEDGCPAPPPGGGGSLGSDLVTGNVQPGCTCNGITLLLGDGTGNYSVTSFALDGNGWDDHAVAVGDFDKDGEDDILMMHARGAVYIDYGNTPGIVKVGVATVTGNPFQGVAAGTPVIADFNNDTWPDLAVKSFGNLSVFLNDQTGALGSEIKFQTGGEPRSLAAGDIDGDGNQDLVNVAEAGHGSVNIHYGDGNGGFTWQQIGAGDDPSGQVQLADIDGDSDLDIVAGSWIGKILFYLNDGGGNFTSATLEGAAPGVNRLLLATDLNGDGAPDLITTTAPWDSIQIWFNDGTGDYPVLPDIYTIGGFPLDLVLFDENGDSNADIAVSASISNVLSKVFVLRGNGSGLFSAATEAGQTGQGPVSIASGDFN